LLDRGFLLEYDVRDGVFLIFGGEWGIAEQGRGFFTE
jgi:hypothetical protein